MLASGRLRTQPCRMLTSGQIRAARGLLDWSAVKLARCAGVSPRTINSAERADGVPRMHIETLEKIKAALEAAGIELIPTRQSSVDGGPGVRLRQA